MKTKLIEVCRTAAYSKGFTYGPHAHLRLEVNFIISGKALLKIDQDVARFNAGECMIIYPHSRHYFEAESNLKMLQIEFREEAFKSQYHLPSQHISYLPESLTGYTKIEDARYIYQCLQSIYQEVNSTRLYKDELLDIYFQELLLLITRRTEEQNKLMQVAANSPLLSKAINYMSHHYTSDFSMETLAQELGISSRYLRQVFEKELNTNACTYLMNLRISKAKELLLTNSYTNSEIAYMSGFNSPQYFSKCFKNQTGVTPNDFKKQLFRKV